MPGTSVDLVQVTVQTDKVLNIPCGTSGGVLVTFESIEVVNRLKKDMVIPMIRKYGLNYDKIWIFDKIHHEINQFCSKHTLHDVYIQLFDTMDENLSKALQIDVDKWAPGLEIIAARVTKPTIPSGIANNFVRMEEENTNLLIRTEEQKVAQLESETEQRVSIIQAEKAAAVMRIHMEKEILNKHMERKVSQINDEMNSGIQTAKADAASYRSQKLAENNVEIMTPQYRQNLLYENLRQQKKIFFGSTLDSLWSWDIISMTADTFAPKSSVHNQAGSQPNANSTEQISFCFT